eukprot:TRINITY_DN9476_c0_g3_i5.p2 TRINITY_DN9476_c0_g3~~TRINITY_DN9476_c0_g3_i5.p2  ORF type:complete len:138 (-),score=15.06 TRINITY_DN9476_c0_g3_i5:19-432(-)
MINVTVRKKKVTNGRYSLYLDYYPAIINPSTGKESRREFLMLKIYANPKSETERAHNKETIEFAELIRSKRLIQLRNKEYGFKENISSNFNFLAFYDVIADGYLNNGSYNNYLSWKASKNYFAACFGKDLSLSLIHI